ncbi:hypothetical protein WKK_00730 [Weissella koreensis KACC 15510]|nr:hypothetical protein WKK_00730 [Weissella koreensis KACC 15510]
MILERRKGYLMLDALLALVVICQTTITCQMVISNHHQNTNRLIQEQIKLSKQLQEVREQWAIYAS